MTKFLHCNWLSDLTDECALGQHNCDVNADCTNTADNFTCSCKPGYLGNGTIGTCTGRSYFQAARKKLNLAEDRKIVGQV